MILRLPDYFKDFRCIADKCKDSCCIGWEIDIDEETLAYYNEVPGTFGKRLKDNIVENGEDTSFALKKGRCAFLNEKNLCDICTELGETALCEICLEYPRFTLEYGSIREKCLGLSCEEAGKLIFEKEEPMKIEETVISEQFEWKEQEEEYGCDEGYEAEDLLDNEMSEQEYCYLEQARDYIIAILQNRAYRIEVRANYMLLFADAVQEKLNECNFEEIIQVIKQFPFSRMEGIELTVDWKERFVLYEQRMKIYETLELLDKEWDCTMTCMKQVFQSVADYKSLHKALDEGYERKETEYEHLLVYYVFRYGMKAVYDSDFLEKIKFSILSFLVIRDMDAVCLNKEGHFTLENRIDMARIYSKEVEHSEDNLRILAEACVFEETFSTKSLNYCL